MRYARWFALCIVMFAIGSTAHALELTHVQTLSEADANYCGDLNEIAIFEISKLDKNDTYEWDRKQFNLNRKNFYVISTAIREKLGSEAKLVVTNQYEHALNHLVEDLSLDYDHNEEPFLSSCHSLEILRDFGLRVSRSARRIQPIWETENHFSYFTLSELGDFDASDMQYNVAIDLERKRLLVYRIW